MAIFNSYVSLPEGRWFLDAFLPLNNKTNQKTVRVEARMSNYVKNCMGIRRIVWHILPTQWWRWEADISFDIGTEEFQAGCFFWSHDPQSHIEDILCPQCKCLLTSNYKYNQVYNIIEYIWYMIYDDIYGL